VILANCATLAGHVTIEDQAIIGGLTPVHQFVRIGKLSYIGGGSRVPQDIPPFSLSAGIPLKVYGLNVIGLRRKNYSREDRALLKRAFKLIFSSSMNTAQALHTIKSEDIIENKSVKYLVDFIKNSERGISKS
jgi:UDP-N-acetylglucosamine acyltransferase